jgi:hypothetical protein
MKKILVYIATLLAFSLVQAVPLEIIRFSCKPDIDAIVRSYPFPEDVKRRTRQTSICVDKLSGKYSIAANIGPHISASISLPVPFAVTNEPVELNNVISLELNHLGLCLLDKKRNAVTLNAVIESFVLENPQLFLSKRALEQLQIPDRQVNDYKERANNVRNQTILRLTRHLFLTNGWPTYAKSAFMPKLDGEHYFITLFYLNANSLEDEIDVTIYKMSGELWQYIKEFASTRF